MHTRSRRYNYSCTWSKFGRAYLQVSERVGVCCTSEREQYAKEGTWGKEQFQAFKQEISCTFCHHSCFESNVQHMPVTEEVVKELKSCQRL